MTDETQIDDIQEVPGTSPDFHTELANKLQGLIPEAIADGKVDVQKLKELLDGDTADDNERFGLFWPGKRQAMRAAQLPTTATLKPAKDESKDWDTTQNIFIEGDNLEVLKVLQKHYHNKIKMIYIDPPYNTGNDFVYPDNYKEGLKSYLEFTKQVDGDGRRVHSNSESDGRYHSNWLNMMYPRLKLARNLLTDDGVIFISIDDHEQDNLKKICNEIFGEGNFIAQLIWKNKKGGGNDAKFIAVEHEYVISLGRNTGLLPKLFIEHTEEYLERYNQEDEKGRYYWDTFKRKSGKQYYPIVCPDGSVLEFDEDNNPISWLRSEPRLKQDIKDGEVRFLKVGQHWSVQFKQRIPLGKKPRSIFVDMGSTSTGSAETLGLFGKNIFDNPKPTTLIKALIDINTTDEDLILDFFAGSGTTADAVMQLNAVDDKKRRCVSVQLPEPTLEESGAYKAGYKSIADISKERIRRAGEKIKIDFADKLAERETPLDVGFKVFKLADTNFAKWQNKFTDDPEELQMRFNAMAQNINKDSMEEDILAEILIKLGFSLATRSEKVDIDSLGLWKIADGSLLAYLGKTKPTLAQLRKVVATEPTRLVILDTSFNGDDELKTNVAQLCKTTGVEMWTV
jgi:adenine-specific DNA-methyltransferase